MTNVSVLMTVYTIFPHPSAQSLLWPTSIAMYRFPTLFSYTLYAQKTLFCKSWATKMALSCLKKEENHTTSVNIYLNKSKSHIVHKVHTWVVLYCAWRNKWLGRKAFPGNYLPWYKRKYTKKTEKDTTKQIGSW